jgi:O-acetyl-ADP-ribose deacetylase (regulator of RNase III)
MRISWNHCEKSHGRLNFRDHRGQRIDNGASVAGVRAYNKFLGKILSLFNKTEKLEIVSNEGRDPQVFYINRKSLMHWLNRNRPEGVELSSMETKAMIETCLEPYKSAIGEKPGVLKAVKGNILHPQRFKVEGQIAVVNAANSGMVYGGGGLNQQFSKLIRREDWDNAKNDAEVVGEGFGKIPNGGILKTGQAAKGPKLRNGMLLIQALGPDLRNGEPIEQSNFDRLVRNRGGYKDQVKGAYVSALQAAEASGCYNVQVPLISIGIFAGSLSPLLQRQWVAAVKEAVREAIEELPEDSQIREVILVEYEKE